MNFSIGVNRDKELNTMMKRVMRPRIFEREECIFSCDNNYDDGYDYNNDEQYDLEDDDDDGIMEDMMECGSKLLMYVGLGVVVGALGIYLLRR